MRRLLCSFLLLLVWTKACTTTTTADAEGISPDGSITISNIDRTNSSQPYFEIKTKDGKVLYSTKDSQGENSGWAAHGILWSKDSKVALFYVDWFRWQYACIFSVLDNKVVYIHPDEDRFNTNPVRWIDSQRFVIEVSGPHGTHARDPFTSYRQTYRITIQPLKLECIYTGPKTIVPPEDDEKQ